MDISDVLALTALIVSVVSAFFSHRAHRQTTDLQIRETQREFDRERSEFIVRIEKSTKFFQGVQGRIAAVLTQIENQPEDVKASVSFRIDQLRSDLSYLDGALRQSNSLWQENFEMSHGGLAHHKPRHLALLEDDEDFARSALSRAEATESELHRNSSLLRPLGG